jgi:hypothetical protein
VQDQWSITAGLRANYYDITNQFYFAPQLSSQYVIDTEWSLKASFSINQQYVRELSYSSRFGEEVELFTLSDKDRFPVGQSTNYMLGGTYRRDNWLFDIELYRIDRDNVLGFTTFLPRLINANKNNEEGRNYRILNGEGYTDGVDMMVSYQSKAYRGLLSYTLSKSQDRFKEIFQNDPFPTQDDRRHQLSLSNTYSYSSFDFSANAVYASGRIFTDLSLLQAGQDRRDTRQDQFLKRLPEYIRYDLGAAYNFKLSNLDAKFELSVLNLLDHQNVKFLQFTAQVPIETINSGQTTLRQAVLGTQTNQLGRTFNASFQIKF